KPLTPHIIGDVGVVEHRVIHGRVFLPSPPPSAAGAWPALVRAGHVMYLTASSLPSEPNDFQPVIRRLRPRLINSTSITLISKIGPSKFPFPNCDTGHPPCNVTSRM